VCLLCRSLTDSNVAARRSRITVLKMLKASARTRCAAFPPERETAEDRSVQIQNLGDRNASRPLVSQYIERAPQNAGVEDAADASDTTAIWTRSFGRIADEIARHIAPRNIGRCRKVAGTVKNVEGTPDRA